MMLINRLNINDVPEIIIDWMTIYIRIVITYSEMSKRHISGLWRIILLISRDGISDGVSDVTVQNRLSFTEDAIEPLAYINCVICHKAGFNQSDSAVLLDVKSIG